MSWSAQLTSGKGDIVGRGDRAYELFQLVETIHITFLILELHLQK